MTRRRIMLAEDAYNGHAASLAVLTAITLFVSLALMAVSFASSVPWAYRSLPFKIVAFTTLALVGLALVVGHIWHEWLETRRPFHWTESDELACFERGSPQIREYLATRLQMYGTYNRDDLQGARELSYRASLQSSSLRS